MPWWIPFWRNFENGQMHHNTLATELLIISSVTNLLTFRQFWKVSKFATCIVQHGTIRYSQHLSSQKIHNRSNGFVH